MSVQLETRRFTHFHLFSGIGMGAQGFNRGAARLGNRQAKLECVGGIDIDPDCIKNFERYAGVPGTVLDLFDREQYRNFHGYEPPATWRPATPDDIRRAAHGVFPDIVFLSAPCKGFSGLLNETTARTEKYLALNELTLRGVWLMCEAFKDQPPKLIVFENVPRIMTRGRKLLDMIIAILRSYGYVIAETTHDCGELGGLAQSRKRFLLVARHAAQVPPFVYEPAKKKLRSVGEIFSKLPLPGDPAAGPMHRIPTLSWKTWLRLAFVEAGSDWRSLNKLNIKDGYLADYLVMAEARHNGFLGVNRWNDTAGTVRGRSLPNNGAFSVADMRMPHGSGDYMQYGVMEFEDTAGTVTSQRSPGQGTFSVADPRDTSIILPNQYRVVPISEGMDSRFSQRVADPQPASMRGTREHYNSQTHYGVMDFVEHSRAVPGFACHDNGSWSVADPRHGAEQFMSPSHLAAMPNANDRLLCIIKSLDNTWHRPVTTLEMAALQSLIDLDQPDTWWLHASSDGQMREQIGNGVPSDSAEAIGSVFGHTLLLAEAGETFMLSSAPIWCQPIAVALAVDQGATWH